MASFGLQGNAGLPIVPRASLQFVEPVARHFAPSARSLIVHPNRKQGSPGWKHLRGATTADMKLYINNESNSRPFFVEFSSFRRSFAADFVG